MIKTKKITVILAILFILHCIPLTSSIEEPELRNSYGSNTNDVPVWCIGDYWTYEGSIYSNTSEGLFDIIINDLVMLVQTYETMLHDNKTIDIYNITVTGNVSGNFESSILSGDVTGEIAGFILIRQADLSFIHTNISTFGIIEWLLFDFDYDIQSTATYYPQFEYFDFPLQVNETWNSTSTVQQNSSFYVETFYDNTSESTTTNTGNASCYGIHDITVPAGIFSSYHIISNDNSSVIESWYNASVKNMVRMHVNQSNETSINIIHLNLTSFTLQQQSIHVSLAIAPSTSTIDDILIISGYAFNSSSNTSIENTTVQITIPYTEQSYTTQTNETGYYELQIITPLILDPTETTYDIGSDGIKATIFENNSSYFKWATLTVIGVGITDVSIDPPIAYETNPVNISCSIYHVENLSYQFINITGPTGFTTVNTSLTRSGNTYYYVHSYALIGQYHCYIGAKDDIGNTNITDIYTFEVIPDTIPPTISNISVQPNPQYANNEIQISCNVTDNVHVSMVTINITNPLSNSENYQMIHTSDNEYTFNHIFTLQGNYTFYIWTIDTLNNTNQSDNQTFEILLDTQAPLIIDHTTTTAFIGYECEFNATIIDNAAVDDVYVEYWYGSDPAVNETMNYVGNDRWNKTIIIQDTSDDLYYIIKTDDTSNNWNMTSIKTINITEYETLDINQSVHDRGFPIRHAADGDWAGAQNYTPTVSTMTKCEIYLRKFGTPEFDLVVEFREDDIDGTLLDTIILPVADVSTSWTWVELDFIDTVVIPGVDYFIKCPPAPSGVTTSFGYEWGYAFGDQYSEGSFWFTRDGGNLWRDLPTMYEFVFKTYGHN